jgi:DNA-binding response OmpR family regulator
VTAGARDRDAAARIAVSRAGGSAVDALTMNARPLVLIADDDEDILELVRLRLARSGYDTAVAHDGEEALAIARTQRPVAAVLDVSMPVLDGYAVATALRSDAATADIGLILLTARALPSDVERGFEAGADDYVTKPFSPELLAGRVDALVGARKLATADDEPLLRVAP